MIQVTRFKFGGFVVRVTVSHCLVDGCSAMDFMNSFGETARRFPITVPPFLDRSIIKAQKPPKLESQDLQDFGEIEDISEIGKVYEEEMFYSSFYFDLENLEQLKKNALEDGVLDNCTTFQALTAFIGRA
ncbi:Omega-hydroxypalmitate O-feruloyl transferase [Morella rubra]|uniref:Omega-hydroxypalmitate O-feruloyl transferase n=1 Tax=Morella rubra TaxID=262757 RepID=A0A6A1WBK8_9ROSI|nr:Omega-hydroxypalmitate O-feruloyl transferase [Morella rubra]